MCPFILWMIFNFILPKIIVIKHNFLMLKIKLFCLAFLRSNSWKKEIKYIIK